MVVADNTVLLGEWVLKKNAGECTLSEETYLNDGYLRRVAKVHWVRGP
jgi:hypothetical protein